ncbi:MAG: LCP family protein [Cetobacterium sp.]|uniref:LCP family protein n=1 Tax=Cetobacterium sp. TaxID=2071632 RepID=UPI003EE61B2A
MKLSKATLEILANFAVINPSIYLRSGNVISTKSVNNVTYAEAQIEDTIDADIGIYAVNEFLSTLGLFGSDFEIIADPADQEIKIKNARAQVKYTTVDPSVITFPEKTINFPVADVQFELKEEDLKRIMAAARTLRLPEIVVTQTDGKIVVKVVNSEDPSTNSYALEVAEYEGDNDFEFFVRVENMKMIDNTYKVLITKLGAIKFESEKVSYIVALERNSHFE